LVRAKGVRKVRISDLRFGIADSSFRFEIPDSKFRFETSASAFQSEELEA
jgi:hypothetical protein